MAVNKLCVAIRGLRRVKYLKRCLKSLERNSDLDGVDFFFFQDGAVNRFSNKRYATDDEIKHSLETFNNSALPNKTVFKSKDNLGQAIRNEFLLNSLFFDYEYVVLVDNDLIFNRYYIKTLKVLFKQFKKDKKAGVIQTSFRHDGSTFQSLEEARGLENKVSYGFSHLWEMGFWKKSWEKIRPFMKEYFDALRECDFREFMYNHDIYKDIRKKLYKIYGSYHMSGDSTSEDYALSKATKMAGYNGIHTLALRHRTIGEKGLYSFSGNRFKIDNYDKIKLYNVGNVEKYEIT